MGAAGSVPRPLSPSPAPTLPCRRAESGCRPSTDRVVRPAHPPSSLGTSTSLRHSLAGLPRGYPHPSAAASLRSAGTRGLTTHPRIFRTPKPAREPRTQGPPLTSWRRSLLEAASARLPHEYSGRKGSSGHPRGAAPPSSRRHWLSLPVTPHWSDVRRHSARAHGNCGRRAPGEAVPEASRRIAEYPEQNVDGRELRESISFTGIRSSCVCTDYLSSKCILNFILFLVLRDPPPFPPTSIK